MEEPHERLARARKRAGYATSSDAARAMGVSVPTYVHHENGTNGLSRAGRRYADFFRVSYQWLMTGLGSMESGQTQIPVVGYVGAGAVIDPIGNLADAEFPDYIDLPTGENFGALIVRGNSQYPRFLDGEVIIYNLQPARIDNILNRFAVVQTLDGRMLIKIVRRAGTAGRYLLESLNAPVEETELLAAWEYIATLSTRNTIPSTGKPAHRRKTP